MKKFISIGGKKYFSKKEILQDWKQSKEPDAFEFCFGMNLTGFICMTHGLTPFSHKKLIGIK